MNFSDIIAAVNNFVWGPIMLALLMGTGMFLTVRLKFKPWLNLGFALKSVFAKQDKTKKDDSSGDISPFQSLMTALAATIGTGNIVGVATAMVLGGPGALVWMWISALFGLSTKYAESVLAVKYRETNAKGEMAGGPMYAMKNGFKNKKIGLTLAFLFSLFATVASFGIGNMTQANSISGAVFGTFGVPTWITGLILTVLAFLVILGGIKSIGKVAGVIVPFMAVFYVLTALLVIIINYQNLPAGIAEIFTMAFSPQAMAGGVGGTIIASMLSAMRWGVARGVFSNEAGLGSAPIAAAAAKTDHPSRQGYINMTGTFFDTICVCTITGLVIASSGALGTLDASGEILMGANLTIAAFQSALGPIGGYIVTIGIALFAFSTILGWEYYGEKSLEYLIKAPIAVTIYRILYCLVVFVGATTALEVVWNLSDAMNGLMAIPNLISLLVLSSVVAKECFEFQSDFLIPEKLAFKEAKKK
ncbi:sodium:alanine symporter family protein [Acetobacterium sp.]|jgi:AGCS family alanine or glycine:cation symporter|uniref:alanine/glycine:cation symporter family protein n=1 Tax=Acetobacterium sp. TaxID=1872094 RepID=UPI002719F96F|nr:sodium:alanine symporter family protein [Acetobacterium sp.]MDO9491856.1 sodium:alanine symporter family protein [Acetobacterium sp.]